MPSCFVGWRGALRVGRLCRVALIISVVTSFSESAALATPITFTLINPSGNQSRLDLLANVDFLGGALTAEPQVPPGTGTQGSLSTTYNGTIQTVLTQSSMNLPGGSAAAANNVTGLFGLPLQLQPGVGGAAGTAPGDYGVKLTAPVNLPLPPIDLSAFGLGTLNLGTLQSVDVNIALRDVELDLITNMATPLNPGFTLPQQFDASDIDIGISGNADIGVAAVLKAPDLGTYLINILALQGLAALVPPEFNLSVVGNIFNQTISIGSAFGTTLPSTLANNSGAGLGTLEQIGGNFRLTIPVDFNFVPDLPPELALILQADLGLQGQLVAQAPFQVVIPEPSSWVLSALAIGGVGLFIRRRRGRKA